MNVPAAAQWSFLVNNDRRRNECKRGVAQSVAVCLLRLRFDEIDRATVRGSVPPLRRYYCITDTTVPRTILTVCGRGHVGLVLQVAPSVVFPLRLTDCFEMVD